MTKMFERTPSASRAEIVEGGEPTTETRLSKAVNQQPRRGCRRRWTNNRDEGVEGDEPTTEGVEGDEPTIKSVEGDEPTTMRRECWRWWTNNINNKLAASQQCSKK